MAEANKLRTDFIKIRDAIADDNEVKDHFAEISFGYVTKPIDYPYISIRTKRILLQNLAVPLKNMPNWEFEVIIITKTKDQRLQQEELLDGIETIINSFDNEKDPLLGGQYTFIETEVENVEGMDDSRVKATLKISMRSQAYTSGSL